MSIHVSGWREETRGQSILILAGDDEETGDIVEVAADHRPGEAIIAALMRGEYVTVDPEPYLILSRRRPHPLRDGGRSPYGIANND